ncbi:hypothetical protein EJB05_35261 [Eragrostis curvula]|uniref:Uncharacterized protein n=1 Tax=Eragrostis curvula TaxID=38414 RepID=A0A5J9U6M1_9POAL|nr:hypothetical protein EJB05_35261 [Eragrostis curvula]
MRKHGFLQQEPGCCASVFAVNSRLASVELWEEIILRRIVNDGHDADAIIIKEAWALDKVMQPLVSLAFGPVDLHAAVVIRELILC